MIVSNQLYLRKSVLVTCMYSCNDDYIVPPFYWFDFIEVAGYRGLPTPS